MARYEQAQKMQRASLIANSQTYFNPWDTIVDANPQRILERGAGQSLRCGIGFGNRKMRVGAEFTLERDLHCRCLSYSVCRKQLPRGFKIVSCIDAKWY